MRKYIPVLVLMLFLSQSCIMGQNKREVTQNDKIDPKVKAAVTTLNNEVYRHMSESNYDALVGFFSDSLRGMVNGDFERKFMPSMQSIIKGHKYRIYDEFHIKGTKHGDTVALSSGKGDEAYTIKFTAQNSETYLVMLVAGDTVDEVMLTLTYGNYKGKWQLFGITGEDYSLDKKNAIAQYNYAQSLQKKGYLIDAVNIMGMANHCIKPGGWSFSFKKEKELRTFSDTLNKETKAKYPFPYTVKEIATKPLVVNIHYEMDKGDFIPMIIYQSVINVLDSNSLKKENAEIQKTVGKIFTGMDIVNKRLFYRVYNELPNGQNQPSYFGCMQTL